MRVQQYVNQELSDVQAGFRKSRGTRDQIANILWVIEKAKEFQKNIYFFFIDNAKAFGCVDHNKLWKILQEMGISDHLICLLRNLYAGEDATVRTGHETMDWFQIGICFKTAYCHSVYLTYIQNTSCRILGWMKKKLESNCQEKYQCPQICRWHYPYGRKPGGTKDLFDENEIGEWKRWLKMQH